MEKNPVFEFPDQPSTSEVSEGTARGNARPKYTSGKKVPGRTCALATFAALVVLALVGVIAIIVFRPTTTESKTETSASSDQVELLEQEMKNLRELVSEQATKHASNISSLKQLYGNAIQEMQQQISDSNQQLQLNSNQTIQEVQNQLHKTNEAMQQLLNNSIQGMQQKLVQLTAADQNIEAKIENTTQMHNQRYLDCKQTVVSLNKQTQRNVSQHIELQATKCSEGINALQLQANNSNTAIQIMQMDIKTLESNLTETSTNVETLEYKFRELNATDIDQRALSCEGLSPPTNGGVNVQAGPNSLTYGLGSVATYSCDPGYALVGQRTRTCQDNNGGTVTMGTWSGALPLCQDIHCSELATPNNGNVVLSDPALLVGTIATYNCNQGYVLAGDTTRSCKEGSDRTIGTWNGTMPICEVIIICQPLTQPSNGVISISTGTHGVNLGVGAIATYSCNSGHGLVGQASRTCVSGGGITGTWSGAEPTCEEILTCPSISPPTNGAITFTPGADNSNIGLGSVATYSCNLGYVLVGHTTRVCQSLYGGASAAWSVNPPICREAVYCPVLTAPGNGSVTVSSGFNPLSVGSVATYSCDPGYALLGTTTRNCADPDSDSVGTWTGAMPECQVIFCAELTVPENGTLVISSTLLGVGTTASYTCNQGHVLVGDVTRTCQDTSGGTATIGTWSGSDPTCAVPNRAMIDCQDTACRYEQLVCPEQDNCTVGCYDSRSYACFQTDVYCPSGRGDCTLNCDDSYSCLQANTTCPQGDCIVNCLNDYTCLSSAFECSGDNCIFNCQRQESCSNSNM
ncbi:sushi, von Willebrand factor type A, EGF and pentraxin domain-containing protein 1-like isoform X2 [Halichondria panicea]|uniref:sushi, von Willebrand factor type A, EGF and pentraxin domain-containing protein 1-like isoform X2 n=1 Tax=Halichondria panicea TaxID=6063 RepID=UPI00312B6253